MYLTKTGMQITVIPGQRGVPARAEYTYCRPAGGGSSGGGSSGSGSSCRTFCVTSSSSDSEGQGGVSDPVTTCYRVGNCSGPN